MSDTKPVTADPRGLASIQNARKLTIKRVVGEISTNVDVMRRVRAGETVWLADFYCYVTSFKIEESSYGKYNRWLGEFRSVNLLDGEVLKAANCILPKILDEMIEAGWASGNKGSDSSNVLIAFRCGVSADLNKVGYKYECKDIKPGNVQSALDLLYDAANPAMLTDQSQDAAEKVAA